MSVVQVGAGDLRELVVIQDGARVKDAQGGSGAPTWAPRANVWAHVVPASGTEAVMAEQLTAVLSTVVTIRFRDDVSVKDRVILRDRTLQVESRQDPDGRRNWLQLLCSEVLS